MDETFRPIDAVRRALFAVERVSLFDRDAARLLRRPASPSERARPTIACATAPLFGPMPHIMIG